MPEPMDTIRRVNSDDPMTLDELYQARAELDRHTRSGKTDVKEARRRVGAMINERMAEYEPVPAAPAPAVPASESGATVAPGVKEKKPGNPILGFVALLIIVGTIIYSCSNRDDEGGGDGRDDIGAGIACETFVERQLRAPSTADFPSHTDYVISGSGDRYVVNGYVDAQNGFGAMIRTDWTCTVLRDNANEQWTLESLTGL